MTEDETFSADELLRHYLSAPFEVESAKFLDLLTENYVLPTIKKILGKKFFHLPNDSRLSLENYEDLQNECCLKMIGALRLRKITNDAAPIRDFSAYCAVIVYNVWNSFVRENSPNRESLKNKIRYSLDKDERFLMKTVDNGEKFYYLKSKNFRIALDRLENIVNFVKDSEEFAQIKLPDLIAMVFDKAEGGLTIENLLKIIADLWQINDFPDVSFENISENSESSEFRQNNFEMRCKLEYLWLEIRSLPVLQRTALLYNLRDERGDEMLLSFFNTRLATLEELAEAINLTKPEFIKLLPLLPFDDKKIAETMNLTIKQIGNLRKAARDNLRRRLEGKAKRQSANSDAEKYIFIVDENNNLTAKKEFLN